MLIQNKSKYFYWILFGFCLGTFLTAHAAQFPRQDAIPGGIAIVDLEEKSQVAPVVKYRKNRVLVRRKQQSWQAVVGIPLAAKAGKHTLKITPQTGRPYKKSFAVRSKKYATQHLTIKNKRLVDPTAEDMKRIRREKKIITSALATWQGATNIQTQFILPVTGRFSSPFGLRRFFNGQARKPHSGLDIAAPQGTPIKAPANGTVITSGNYFFNGNTIFIDHGQGLVTMFSHLHQIKVKPGAHVKQGDIIASVGMTGRATGPNLHWGVSLNNTRIEPKLFLNTQLATQ